MVSKQKKKRTSLRVCYIDYRVEPHYPVIEHKTPLRRRTKGREPDRRFCRLVDVGCDPTGFGGRPPRLGSTQGEGATL